MSDLTLTKNQQNVISMFQAAKDGDLEAAEGFGLQLPQLQLKVVHYFGPGFCIREMHIPAGAWVIGHAHKEALSNSFIKGRVKLLADGQWQELTAPLFFVGKPGRKMAVALEDSIWQNILVTDETDPDKIESLFVTKSKQWQQAQLEGVQS